MYIICIDSFKPEYLKYAPYLSSLTKKYQHGELETNLGFEGQMEEFFTGKHTKLALYYKNDRSSLKWTRNFAFFGKYLLNVLINLHRLLKNKRRLIFTHNIPLKKLHYFDTSVDYEPTQYLNVKYMHIGILDATVHKYGTSHDKTIKCIKQIDNWLKTQNFYIVMSDHGMMNINEIITVPETEVCFIDSTMARYWNEKPELPLDKGKIIKADEKYGETIFLANPGVLILPNYWQGKKQVKAMHGYDSKHEDMKAFYLIKKEGKRKDLTMNQLHEVFAKNLS